MAVLLADPDGAPQRIAGSARAQLEDLETLGRVALLLDSGPAPLRRLLGLRPAREVAAEILADGAAGISREVAAVTPLLPAVRAARRPARAGPTSFTDAIATWLVDAVRRPDHTPPPEAERVLSHVNRISESVDRARLRLVVLVLGLGGLRWLECLGLGLAIRTWLRRRAPSLEPPAARALDRAKARTTSWRWFPRKTRGNGIEEVLVSSGVPPMLAAEIAARFAEAPDWPGSLRGHDREPGGLREHTLRVLTGMREATAEWSPEAQRAAAVVAAAHDLGKLVAYRRVGSDRWVGSASTPHDSLSAILLMQCPSWPTFASAEIRSAILQALYSEHAHEGLPTNAAPLARDLLEVLAVVDAAAARENAAGPGPTIPANGGSQDVT